MFLYVLFTDICVSVIMELYCIKYKQKPSNNSPTTGSIGGFPGVKDKITFTISNSSYNFIYQQKLVFETM